MGRNGPTKTEIAREEDAQFQAFLRKRGGDIQDKFLAGRARSLTDAAARERLFLDQLEASFAKLDGRYVVGKDYRSTKSPEKIELALNANISDVHFGAALDKREVPVAYGHVEEARRIAKVALWLAEHRTLAERREMDLHLNFLGDIIQNQLHDPRDGAPLTDQVNAAIHLLTQLVFFVTTIGGYRKVFVHCTPGNHGRNTARHKDRATNQKWDALETMIYFSVKNACRVLKNVSFDIPYEPFFTYEVLGHSVFGTHGDTVIKPGFPNRAIEIENVRKQINEINAKLSHDDRHKVFIAGHVHVSSKTKLPNGVYFMTNGCLIPTDAYAQSIGIMDTACCQTVFETTAKHPVGYHCEIDVDESTDKDKALDKVITPYAGLNT
jgi:hypothetical protein